MIASADVWLNGNLVAGQAPIAGAYPVHETRRDTLGACGQQHPGIARASGGCEDEPVDRLGRLEPDAAGQQHGSVARRGYRADRSGRDTVRPRSSSTLSLPDLVARRADREGGGAEPRCVGRTSHASRASRGWRFAARTVRLAPGEAQTVSFSPKTRPGPRPQASPGLVAGRHGSAAALHLQVAASVDGAISDRASATFGIRSVSSHLTPQGYLQFVINGKPVLIRGARLGAGHVPARRSQAHGGRVQLRP